MRNGGRSRVVRLNEAGLRRLVRGILKESGSTVTRRVPTTLTVGHRAELEECMEAGLEFMHDEQFLQDLEDEEYLHGSVGAQDKAWDLRASQAKHGGTASYEIQKDGNYLVVVLRATNETTISHLQTYIDMCEEDYADEDAIETYQNLAADHLRKNDIARNTVQAPKPGWAGAMMPVGRSNRPD
jgi:hypothetical protein